MNLLSLFKRKPRVQVYTFTKKAIKERDLVHKTCQQLAHELGRPVPEVLR